MRSNRAIKRLRIIECQAFSFTPPIASAKVASTNTAASSLATQQSEDRLYAGAACVKLQVDCPRVSVKIELDHGPINTGPRITFSVRAPAAWRYWPRCVCRLGGRPVNHDPDCKQNQGDHAQEQVCRRQRDENRAQPQKLVQDGQHDRCHRERPKNYLLSQERQSSERKIK